MSYGKALDQDRITNEANKHQHVDQMVIHCLLLILEVYLR